MRTRRWLRRLGAASLGAITMLVLGQALALAGGRCMILCRPPIAAAYGALVGLLLLGSVQQRRESTRTFSPPAGSHQHGKHQPDHDARDAPHR